MNFNGLDWLQICADGQTTPCIQPIQVWYLVALLVGVVLLAIIGRRARDFTTAVLSLMAVAIAINIAVGSIVYALRLPIYLDSIGTVLVGALAGPWAGALTGILSNLIWSILPIPGGASPTAAFFAPVAGVIGLMAGFWASRGVFQFRSDDARVGGFLSLAAGFVGAAIALLVVQATIGLTDRRRRTRTRRTGSCSSASASSPSASSSPGSPAGRLRPQGERPADPDLPDRRDGDLGVRPRVRPVPPAVRPERLLLDGRRRDPTATGRSDPLPRRRRPLTGLALPDPAGLIAASSSALIVGFLAFAWARRGENARLFPVWIGGATTGLVAAMISAPIAAGVFGGVTGGGTDRSSRCSGRSASASSSRPSPRA